MADIYLIEYAQLTNATPLGGDIDVDRYKFCILDAQNSKIKELLGDTLYTKIETDYDEDNLTGNYLTLYNEFVKPILIHQSAVEYLTIGSFQIANGGIYKHTPQNGTAVELSDVKYLIDAQRTKVEMYTERLNRWLLRLQLPEYNWYYENIVNPMPTRGGNLNFDITGNTDKWREGKSDNRMDNCFENWNCI
jgi:hypothetical protein